VKLPKDAYEAAVSKWNPSQKQQVMDLIYAKPEAFMGERMRHYTRLLSLVSSRKKEELEKALKEVPFKTSELVDGTGKNLLIWAAIAGAENDILAMLIRSGIDPNHQDVTGNTALTWVIHAGPPEAEKPRVIRCLIENGADPDMRTPGGQSANDMLSAIERQRKASE
jgi:hypothetical protein